MNNKEVVYRIVSVIIIVIAILIFSDGAKANNNAQPTLRKIEATAYYDVKHLGYSANGQPLVEGLTLAGREQDLGKTALLYDEDLRLIGIYEFRDVGYGQSTGHGTSNVIKGRPKGTIEIGECVDIYMQTKEQCKEFGRRKVYIQIVKAVG